MPTNLIFVYGSLRSGFKSPAYDYISRFFTLVGDARVKGQLYDMGDYPSAVPGGDQYLVGELYQIKDEREYSWAMGQLDDYEGMTVEEGEQPLYRRELTEGECNGQPFVAWIYWYNGDVTGRPLVSSGDALKYLQEKNKQ